VKCSLHGDRRMAGMSVEPTTKAKFKSNAPRSIQQFPRAGQSSEMNICVKAASVYIHKKKLTDFYGSTSYEQALLERFSVFVSKPSLDEVAQTICIAKLNA